MNDSKKNDRTILQEIARKAMLDNGFRIDFPDDALHSLDAVSQAPVPADGSLRDLRELPWCSIDNDDSRDLDQLTVARTDATGNHRVLVAIADVDSRVGAASPFEEHAQHNTTSVYTPARIFPMLPERLSTDLTSLNFNEDRLALVVEWGMAEDGSVNHSEIYRAVVRNKSKLTYSQVAAGLGGDAAAWKISGSVVGLNENLTTQSEIARSLKSLRYQNGALNLETIDARPVLTEDAVSRLDEEQNNAAKDMIQEFMIAANGITARFLTASGFPSLRRIVRVPKRWDRIVALAGEWKFTLPTEPDSKALDQFLLSVKSSDPVRFPDLSLSVIKLLGSGEYTVEGPQASDSIHFGLAVRDYTHSTAPNRRYPDLITQRLLKAALGRNAVPYTVEMLNTIARHCTAMEDLAKKVERRVSKSAAALMLGSRIGEQFDGIVTGASDKGTWVRVFHPAVEGKLQRGFEGADVGDRIRVELTHTDVERGFIDFKKVLA